MIQHTQRGKRTDGVKEWHAFLVFILVPGKKKPHRSPCQLALHLNTYPSLVWGHWCWRSLLLDKTFEEKISKSFTIRWCVFTSDSTCEMPNFLPVGNLRHSTRACDHYCMNGRQQLFVGISTWHKARFPMLSVPRKPSSLCSGVLESVKSGF